MNKTTPKTAYNSVLGQNKTTEHKKKWMEKNNSLSETFTMQRNMKGSGRGRSGQLEFDNMQIGSHDLNYPIVHLTSFSLLSVRKKFSTSFVPQ